ncbi:hypothetical protein [Streptomyces flaveolus]|uniref:hypothetical protein n=1 Tax=Streptomyces flaveolus TaxID=67297 RepID=UPI0036F59898
MHRQTDSAAVRPRTRWKFHDRESGYSHTEVTLLPQAIAYQVNGPPVHFLVVLDLTDKPDGLAAVPACVHARTVSGPADDPRPRTVIMLRIQETSATPTICSRYGAGGLGRVGWVLLSVVLDAVDLNDDAGAVWADLRP